MGKCCYFQSWVDEAAKRGHLDVVEWLFDCDVEFDILAPCEAAARAGHLAIVQLVQNYMDTNDPDPPGTWPLLVIDDAAPNGHLHILRWAEEYNRTMCTTDFQDSDCSTSAMDGAAGNGHLNVVRWLHVNRTQGCTTDAMDSAASNGHLTIVKWLHVHRTEGCTTKAMEGAAASGHLNIVKWLYVNCPESRTEAAITTAFRNGHSRVAEWLRSKQESGSETETDIDF